MRTKPSNKGRPQAIVELEGRRRQPWLNTKPPGNAPVDQQDLDRSMRRLESLVGR